MGTKNSTPNLAWQPEHKNFFFMAIKKWLKENQQMEKRRNSDVFFSLF
jgi:hypothetical protein